MCPFIRETSNCIRVRETRADDKQTLLPIGLSIWERPIFYVRYTTFSKSLAVRLPIGQFYLDRVENMDGSVNPKDAYSLMTAHSQTNEAGYTAEATFSKGKADGLHLRLPRPFEDTGYQKDFEKVFEDSERVEYVYGLRVPKTYYTENDVESINVEMLWTQTTPEGEERYVFQEYVPLDL